MKAYIVVLLLLKFSMLIQLILILAKVQTEDHLAYLISDALFKGLLGLFLVLYFFINGTSGVDNWDEVFIGFGGTLLMFDSFYNVFPKILKHFNIYFNPYTFYWSTHPEIAATVN